MRKEMMTSINGTFLTQNFEPLKPTDNLLRFEGEIYLLIGIKHIRLQHASLLHLNVTI